MKPDTSSIASARNASFRRPRPWALVLAGGEGTRLRQLTTDASGTAVPKQYCSLTGGNTLLDAALSRARQIAGASRTCSVVSETHRRWWQPVLGAEVPQNVIVQPRGRGTGIGILFSALHIAARDPDALLVVLPADHYVASEDVLRDSMLGALGRLAAGPDEPILLGLEPSSPDSELGYVVPGTAADETGMQRVGRFVEKPDALIAQDIMNRGALWNLFILAASVRSLVRLFMQRFAVTALEMQAIVSAALHAQPAHSAWAAIVEMYERLPQIDFSRDILQQQPQALRVMRVPECGWSDLGTPARVAATLQRLPPVAETRQSDAVINLALQHAKFEGHAAARAQLM
ncbi:MAG TPA: sugar phosphate nucleotidyltransferase [Povalibacter sp.]|uniref:sugar phosphate nucleotidyltransferase n=1 Tax=Povalibacter sp. TaxID=1962978 RepID=UPI002CF07C98|nr:sugar phosphate nucleotidyltransferase [Povalibacter sp.]HMN44113.1 sugar phosphate nucleotidyltransferase [Povalibacter sp.]